MAARGDGGADDYRAALEDWRSAPIDERLRAALGFLEKLALRPSEVGQADVEELRRAGLNDQAIEEAIGVAAGFAVIDRLADAFDFALPNEKELRVGASILLRFGYRLGSLPG